MTIEEVKAILSRARFTRLQVEMLKEEIDSIRSEAESMTAKLSGLPGGGGVSDKVGEGAVRIVSAVTERTETWEKARDKAEKLIDLLDKPKQQIVLRAYYLALDMPTWEDVCVRIKYSWRNTHYLHSAALIALSKKIA